MGFKRTKEDFKCFKCGQEILGNGYTNHCPHCLWSLHVDIEPGDRLNPCGGKMEPIGLETDSGEFRLIHKCLNCGEVKKVKTVKADNIGSYLTGML